MRHLEIRIIGGEVYVPLYAVAELLKQIDPLAQMAQAQQVAIKHQAVSVQQGIGLEQVICGETQAQFVPHEQDYRGLSR